jgi:DNA recombination protein RmuC
MIDAAIAVIAFLFGATVAYLFSQRTVVGSLRTQAEELLNLRQQNADITAKLGRAEERASLADTLVKERDIARDQSIELRAQLSELETARQLAVAAQQTAESHLLELQDRHAKEIAQLREDHQLAQTRFEQRVQEQLRESQDALKDTFENMAGQVVQKAQEDFIKVSEAKAEDDLTKRQRSIQQLLEPITKELEEVKKISQTIDKERHASFEMLGSGIQTIQKETERLANALRKPQSRGAWGEMQLELTLTNAGLIEGQDFSKQDSTTGDEGILRSDFVINLTNQKKLVIDCKVPLSQYMEAMNAGDELSREQFIKGHIAAVRGHIREFGKKNYWSRYEGADCAVLFIPHEGAYNLAMEREPSLADEGQQNRVYLAGPHSILAVVHLARYVMNQSRAEKEAQRILDLGGTMVDRMAVVADHLTKLGRNLGLAVGNYNETIGSMERNLLTTGRDMQKIGVQAKKSLPALTENDPSPTIFVKPELAQKTLELP